MDAVPAVVLGRGLDILAWNRMARALLGDCAAWEPQERNMARQVFLGDNARSL
ncbi:hypothetical protein [Streptomyces sp. C10-9-1]|uniref:MmyB family transcriptional regulator n=1 Tax=Streptomyces sp. C10-9-1 TaxID=1859285 RepID=UPI003D70B345